MGWIRRKEFNELAAFGQYDLIICKEMLYEVHEHYATFFQALKDYNLKPGGHVVIIALAKEHGPVPLPAKAVNQWRHLVASKEEIYNALVEVIYANCLNFKTFVFCNLGYNRINNYLDILDFVIEL